MRFLTTIAGPGFHPGYKITRSPDEGRRPESGEVNTHPITPTFSQ
jgi:hypothetical protein